MTINTIIAIIAAISLIYSTASLGNKKRITANDIIAMLMSMALFVVMCKSGAVFSNNIQEAYDMGFNTAIHAAELVNVGDDYYSISFGEEVHYYTSNGSHLVDLKNR